MKRTHKKIFGLFGLLLVVAVTVFAAFLPGPEVQAVNSVTDTIVVRVLSNKTDVSFVDPSPKNEEEFVLPEQTISFIYEGVQTVKVTLEYTDEDGVVHVFDLDTIDADYSAGSGNINIDLSSDEYGYGEYVVRIRGDGPDGILDEDAIKFSYYPLTATGEEDPKSGDFYANLDYNKDNENIDKIILEVYDENGNLVTSMSPITVTPPDDRVKLPFLENNLPSGKYTILATAYDANGQALYRPYKFYVDYNPIYVPNTGSIFNGLNISKSDYLTTGLTIFGIIGIGSIIFIAKRKKNSRR